MDETTLEQLQALFAANEDTAEALTGAYAILLGGVPSESGYIDLINNAISTNYGAGAGVDFNEENIFINIFNSLVKGNAAAASTFDGLIGDGTSLADQVATLYAQFVPEANQTPEGLAYMIRPEALEFYQAVAAERGVEGEDGPAIVALASLIEILRDADIGIGAQINDLTEQVAAGTDGLPEGSNTLTPLGDATTDTDTNTDTDPDTDTETGGGGGGGGGGGPTSPFTNSYADLSGEAVYDDGNPNNADEMYAGGGNPTTGFALSTNASAAIQLGLDARYRSDPSEIAPVDTSPSSGPVTFEMDADRGDAIRFAYSVASTDGDAIDLAAYDFKLYIDTDAGAGQTWIELDLVADGGDNPYSNNSNSSYDWANGGTPVIEDDGGSDSVSQNIQAFHWYNGGNVAGAGDQYSVRLAAFEKGTSNIVADTEILIDVDHGSFTNSYADLSGEAVYDDGDPNNADEMYAGGGNPTTGFALSTNASAAIQLGLDARYRSDASEIAPVDPSPSSGPVTFEMDADRGDAIRFAYSVSSTDGDAIDPAAYDFKLYIDTDAGAGQTWIELDLVPDGGANPYSNNSNSSYDWANGVTPVILDDGGSDSVSQNIQAFHWYNGGNVAGAGDQYSVRLAAFEKGTSNIVADTEILIDVVDTTSSTMTMSAFNFEGM